MNQTIVSEFTSTSLESLNVFSKLSDNRVLFISEFITPEIASSICSSLMLKNKESKSEKITIFLNSEGGDIRSVFMIYDVMKAITATIQTIAVGTVFEESLLLLTAGKPAVNKKNGERFVSKNSYLCLSELIHENVNHGNMNDAKSALKRLEFDNNRFFNEISKNTGLSVNKLKSLIKDGKFFMNSQEAVKLGFADKVLIPCK